MSACNCSRACTPAPSTAAILASATRQMPRRDRAGRGGTHVGEIAVVEQQRLDQPGAGAEQHHQPVQARQSEPGIVEEPRADLDGEAVEAGHIGRLHVHLAAMLGDVEAQDRRHHHRPWSRVRQTPAPRSPPPRHRAARCGEDRLRSGSAWRSLPPRRSDGAARGRCCAPRRRPRPDRAPTTRPASSAAMPTAPAPSTVSCSTALGVADAGGDLVLGQQDRVVQQAPRTAATYGGCRAPMPPPSESASVSSSSTGTGRPAARLACMAAPRVIETPIDPRLGTSPLHGRGHPGGQPAARQRHQHQFDIRQVLDDLQPDRALTRDHRRRVEGRDFGQTLLAHQPVNLGLRIVLGAADDANFGTLRPHRRNLVVRHQGGHAHDRPRARLARRVRQRPAVIAGRRGDQPAPKCGRIQRQHRVRGAAQLEAAGRLAGFELEMDRVAAEPRQAGRRAPAACAPRGRRGGPAQRRFPSVARRFTTSVCAGIVIPHDAARDRGTPSGPCQFA